MTSGTATRVFDFIYDANGRPFACKYTINGTTTTTMYYALNLQGDVVRIVNANGSTLVKYAYNAWGEVISVTNANDVAITSATHIGNLNPLRYRGYYYDSETGFYYLQSRYYDPTMHRFINADSLASTGQGVLGYNMFAYCNNSPVANTDSSGLFPEESKNQASVYGSGPPVSSQKYLEHLKVVESYAASGIELYPTVWSALMDWRSTYLPLSREYEHVAYLYKINTTLGTYYHFSQTYRGYKGDYIISPNVVIPTLWLELGDLYWGTNAVAQVHTHPAPSGWHNDFPSFAPSIYGGDRIAYELFGYEMYIIPYTRCEGTPVIITVSDHSTWCKDCPY